jgi:hypothetical protein
LTEADLSEQLELLTGAQEKILGLSHPTLH